MCYDTVYKMYKLVESTWYTSVYCVDVMCCDCNRFTYDSDTGIGMPSRRAPIWMLAPICEALSRAPIWLRSS